MLCVTFSPCFHGKGDFLCAGISAIIHFITRKVDIDSAAGHTNKQKFIRTAEKYSQGLAFHDVTSCTKQLGDVLVGKWTIGTLYRMFIPEVLEALSKVIYLDCDVVVNLDLQELWAIDMEGKSIAGAFDEIHEHTNLTPARKLQLRFSGIKPDEYINAGVTVMDLQRIRERGQFSQIASEWLIHHQHLPLFPDQDALNAIFAGDIKFIDAKFNVYDLEQDLSGCIVHMWRGKPWAGLSGAQHERLYWRMFTRSAWGEGLTPDELIDTLCKAALSYKFNHKHGSQCLKRLIKGRKTWLTKKCQPIVILCNEAYHRIFSR